MAQEADFRQTFLRRARKNFGRLAQRITPQRSWQDIVIDDALEEALRDLLKAVYCREAVLVKGFDRKVGGLRASYHAPP